MELNLNKIIENIKQNDFIENFIKELGDALFHPNNNANNIELTAEEELEFDRREFDFLQNYFREELSNLSNGEIYMVTNRYENDEEYHRYKVAQYKDNREYKYITLEQDLPENIQLRDIVRKINGRYIYDGQATRSC